jgi:WD40 repeat protein
LGNDLWLRSFWRVASGGLDNICSVFNLSKLDSNNGAPAVELNGHNGHLSSCRFLSYQQILTSSGDKTCMLWDVETGTCVSTFAEHSGDVLRYDLIFTLFLCLKLTLWPAFQSPLTETSSCPVQSITHRNCTTSQQTESLKCASLIILTTSTRSRKLLSTATTQLG